LFLLAIACSLLFVLNLYNAPIGLFGLKVIHFYFPFVCNLFLLTILFLSIFLQLMLYLGFLGVVRSMKFCC
jgi:hypothetical protein